MTGLRHAVICAALAGCLAACGGDDSTVCTPGSNAGCENGQVCEAVTSGGDPICANALVLRGRVFDLDDDAGIVGARVVAFDENGAPASSVAVSGPGGAYELKVPAVRAEDGTPVDVDVTLRADAEGYQTFPGGVRVALPISTSERLDEDGTWVVASALTEIGLFGLATADSASIHGTVDTTGLVSGVLVVAETSSGPGGARGYPAIADIDGDYAIFNLPAGDYTVNAYSTGVAYEPGAATLADGGEATVDLALATAATGTVSGSIQIVNAPGGLTTSIILVVESTFDENLARGEAPPGIRVGGISTDYTFEGVPAGSYVVLAAFENDQLVRDPDTSIGGTATQHIEVTAGGTTTVEGFKVTEALEVFGPGAQGPEMVSGNPTFRWKDDSSEDLYHLVVRDAFGNLVWETDAPSESGADPEVAYAGSTALEPGMYYQFRAVSIKDGINISATEDLKGVFFLP